MKKLIQVYTGNGKGKTTAAFGLALRASGRNLKTLIIQFLKPSDYQSGEVLAASKIEAITVKNFGTADTWGRITPKKQYDGEAKEHCQKALDYINQPENIAGFDILILDEIAAAINKELLDLEQVITFLEKNKGQIEIVLTGRDMPKKINEIAELVSEINDTKHPFNNGIKARKGIEY